MKHIASARPNDIYTYIGKNKFPHYTTNSDEISEIDKNIIQDMIHIAYRHAITNSRQILYVMIGKNCWLYKDNELSSAIERIKKIRPEWSQQIINNFKL